MRTFKAVLAGLLFVVLGGCADDPKDLLSPEPPNRLVQGVEPQDVPPRSQDSIPWFTASDAEFWEHIAGHDSVVIVGLKVPGAARGRWQDRDLVGASQKAQGRQAVSAVRGLQILHADTLRPLLEVKVSSESELARLRKLPFSDYVEPAVVEMSWEEDWSSCGWKTDTRTNWPRTFAGDYLTPNYASPHVLIPSAWNRAQGANVTIGVPDTGVSRWQAQLHSRFTAGHSGGRWYRHSYTIGSDYFDDCAHGTKISGMLTAPMNGENAAGIAWRANLVSVRMQDKTFNWNRVTPIVEGIREAAGYTRPGSGPEAHKRRIVNMSWGSQARSSIKDEIRHWHARERLFIAAAGQSNLGRVVFPARMAEVVAVSAVNHDLSRRSGYSYGSDVNLAFYLQKNAQQLSPGYRTDELSLVGGSSSSAAAVSGMAALVWSRYPNASRDWVRDRLYRSAHSYPQRNNTFGHGIVNAYRAVGGFWRLSVTHPGMVEPFQTFTATANPAGDGPFRYRWSNGATSRSASYRAGGNGTQTSFWVDVTDTFENRTRRYSGTVRARDTSGCADPTQIDC